MLEKSHINDVLGSADGTTMLTGDDFGLVNVFKWPAPQCAESRSYAAHSEHVVRLAVNKENNLAFTVGGADKSLI